VSGTDPTGPAEVDALADAVREVIDTRGDAVEALEGMPLVGVLFLAITGTPGEEAEIDTPLVMVLRAIRETITGWSCAPSGSTRFASVPLTDLDRLGWRLAAAIEIARRGQFPNGPEGGAP
jgi:hypothetical protein